MDAKLNYLKLTHYQNCDSTVRQTYPGTRKMTVTIAAVSVSIMETPEESPKSAAISPSSDCGKSERLFNPNSSRNRLVVP